MTKEEFKGLAKKHLFVLEGYKTNNDGTKELEIFGFDGLYEQLLLQLVSNNEVALKAFVEEFIEAWEDGQGGDTSLYRQAKSLL